MLVKSRPDDGTLQLMASVSSGNRRVTHLTPAPAADERMPPVRRNGAGRPATRFSRIGIALCAPPSGAGRRLDHRTGESGPGPHGLDLGGERLASGPSPAHRHGTGSGLLGVAVDLGDPLALGRRFHGIGCLGLFFGERRRDIVESVGVDEPRHDDSGELVGDDEE